MKGFVLSLLCLAFLFSVASAASPYCCTANQWSSAVINWDPDRSFFFIGEFVYDYTNSQEFFNAQENIGGKHYNVTYIVLYKKSTGYRFYNGGNCQTFALSGNMPQYCVPGDAIYRGNYSIGYSPALVVNYFEFLRGDDKGTYQFSASGCVPVANYGHSVRNPNVDQEQFFNYVTSVNQNLFQVPSFCKN